MNGGDNLVLADDNELFYKFQCSLIICDEEEQDLISNRERQLEDGNRESNCSKL